MTALFVDTAGWMACADRADPDHERCRAARDHALEDGQPLVTTDFVVDETLSLIRFRLGVSPAAAWWNQVDRSQRLRWERIDSARFEKARVQFFQHKDKDKDFSFTDCTSFVTMRELRLTRVLTTDRHFRQAGFELVPGPSGADRRRPRRMKG